MIVNSKYSSLYFGEKANWKTDFDADVCSIQRYAVGELMRIQFTGSALGYTAKYISNLGIETLVPVANIYTDNVSSESIFEILFSISSTGLYCLQISEGNKSALSYFKVEEEDELKNTILLTYSHRRNEHDTIFVNQDESSNYFNFRVEGGFFPAEKTQAIDNEYFRDQRFVVHHMSAQAHEVSVLTIGDTKGVPQWVGSRINHIFSISDVQVDGIETKRSEGATVEIIELGKYYPLLVFKLKVEQSDDEVLTLVDVEEEGGGGGGGDDDNLLLSNDSTPILTNDSTNIILK